MLSAGRRSAAAVFVLAASVAALAVPGAQPASGAAAAPEVGSVDWQQVSAGQLHTCGVTTSGRAFCWGFNVAGQLGAGSQNAGAPREVGGTSAVAEWASSSAGGSHTCAARTTGRLFCWGADTYGQLGDGSTGGPTSTPREVSGASTDWASVAAGYSHTCGVRTTGRLYCWGEDRYGALGDNTAISNRDLPVEVAGQMTDWAAVSAGLSRTCAIKTTGHLFCWGSDAFGALGNGAPTGHRAVPTEVGAHSANWASVSAEGGAFACAVKTTGRLFCWGDDRFGDLGNGGSNTPRNTPTEVAGHATNWAAVSVGDAHACALKTSGRLFCWGLDANGQLGDSTTIGNRNVPTQVAGRATDWVAVDAGSGHTCALKASGRLFCWGWDQFGALGDGGADADQHTPVGVAAH